MAFCSRTIMATIWGFIKKFHPMEGLGAGDNCYEADFHRLKKTGFTMLVREGNPVFQKVMKYFDDPLVIYPKWAGYLGGAHENIKIKELIGSHRMEILHTSGHAHVETIKKLIRLTNPKVIIPMHTQCADGFRDVPAFAPYRGRVRVLQDGGILLLRYCHKNTG